MSYAGQQQMTAADLIASSKNLNLPRTASTTPPELSPEAPRFKEFELPAPCGLSASASRFDSRAYSLPNLLDVLSHSASRDPTPDPARSSLGNVYSFYTTGAEDLLQGYVNQRAGDSRVWPSEFLPPCAPPMIDEGSMPPPPTCPGRRCLDNTQHPPIRMNERDCLYSRCGVISVSREK
ncbi:MAG: hypothetical protein KVP17_000777 [Porospora cf. gigantea B]|uniref:uncharacterized protein n=1 Tax=Porospora cf. gigantea B TaxID=2853592 RepID=UPI003571E0D0|nr:MAG: hypothetical protein KVP17_000777 [Porospora cf. gigantea B]